MNKRYRKIANDNDGLFHQVREAAQAASWKENFSMVRNWEFYKESVMKNYVPAQIYLYDFKYLFARLAVTAAVAIVVYSVLFGGIFER